MTKALPPPRRETTLLAQEDLGAAGRPYLGNPAVRGYVIGIWGRAGAAAEATTPNLPARPSAG